MKFLCNKNALSHWHYLKLKNGTISQELASSGFWMEQVSSKRFDRTLSRDLEREDRKNSRDYTRLCVCSRSNFAIYSACVISWVSTIFSPQLTAYSTNPIHIWWYKINCSCIRGRSFRYERTCSSRLRAECVCSSINRIVFRFIRECIEDVFGHNIYKRQ